MLDPADQPPVPRGVTIADQYKETMQNLRLGVTMLWEAFKTYFAISTILFTAFAFLNTKEVGGTLPESGRVLLSIGIASIGVLISALGPFAIRRFIQYQAFHLDFGKELEDRSDAGLIATVQKVWGNGSIGAPALTSWVFAAFGALWLVALVAIIVQRLASRPCPPPVSTADTAAVHDAGAR